jgi:Lactate dehydrogenase and related dehydrogenases
MKVLVTFPVDEKFKNIGNEILGKENIIWYPNLEPAEILLVRDNNFPYSDDVKFIQTITAGVDHINFSRIKKTTIVASNAGAYSLSVAEHALALLLSAAKSIVKKDFEIKNGIFNPEETILLDGKILLIIGYGGIGSKFARLAKSFNMRIIAIGRSYKDSYADEFYSLDKLKDLVPKADFILISIPINRHSYGIIDKNILELSKKRAIWVNVARAEILKREDLVPFLKQRKDVVYSTDVWWDEPNVKVPILENLIVTPHTAGGRSGEVMENAFREAFMNIRRFMESDKPRNIVNIEETIWIDRSSLGV